MSLDNTSLTGVALSNVEAGTIKIAHVNVGFTPQQVQELVKAAAVGAVGPLADRIVDLSHRLGVTQSAALTILRTLGHEDVSVEHLPGMLTAAATQILTMRQALSRPTNDNNDTADLRRQAVAALDAGASQEAARLLNVIREWDRETSERRCRAVQESHLDWLAGLHSEAETCTLLARVALAQRDIAGARVRFEEGLQVLAPADPERRRLYASAAAVELRTLGYGARGKSALRAAVYFYRVALADTSREQTPHHWASTQAQLGALLQYLGAQESGTARLKEAVTAFRAVLEEYTRERMPFAWADAQNDLGIALQMLGERESGSARLEEAATIFRAVLEEHTQERMPLKWVSAQNNLGIALQMLGERESGTARLEEAATIFRVTLAKRMCEQRPFDWVPLNRKILQNLGNALTSLDERENSTATLKEAVTAFRASLEEETRGWIPSNWAMMQNNLGVALQRLGEREGGTARLREAVAAFKASLEKRTRKQMPLNWVMTQSNLGNALSTLGKRESGTARLEEAVEAFDACLTDTVTVRSPEWISWARTSRDETQAELRRRMAK